MFHIYFDPNYLGSFETLAAAEEAVRNRASSNKTPLEGYTIKELAVIAEYEFKPEATPLILKKKSFV